MKINRNYSKIKVLHILLVLFIGFSSCEDELKKDVLFVGDSYENIMHYIDANPNYASFSKIVKSAKMTDVLSAYNNNGGDGYTLFLPTNEAVTKYIDESDRYTTLDELLQDAVYAAEIVKYHIVNGRIPSNEFPNGALAKRTISNYFLTIVFREENDAISYAVNDESKILISDIKKDNGTIHTIDKMLTPVVFTSYQWVQQKSNFTIYTELLTKCGLADGLNAFELDELGREVYNEYTLFAESDELYAANGIMSFNDLVNSIVTDGSTNQDFTNPTNLVNRYARYHILEKSVFLDEFATGVYNTYGESPVSLDLDSILKINKGTKIFDVIISKGDTINIDYLQVDLDQSNIVTRSGAIHQLDHILRPFVPSRKKVEYEFYEEPVINALRDIESSFYILDEYFKYISFIGTNYLIYTKSADDIDNCNNNDYIRVAGDVDFSFKTTKILAGRYRLRLVLERGYTYLASVQAYVDDTKVGVVIDATKAVGRQGVGFNNIAGTSGVVGTVEFTSFTTHTVKLSTVIPGLMIIDRIIFEPI